jgi:hypothetical protein
VEGKQSSRESFLEADLTAFLVFRDKRGGDGVSEDWLNDFEKKPTKSFQVGQLIQAGCPA